MSKLVPFHEPHFLRQFAEVHSNILFRVFSNTDATTLRLSEVGATLATLNVRTWYIVW
jgi:hypothetical protein